MIIFLLLLILFALSVIFAVVLAIYAGQSTGREQAVKQPTERDIPTCITDMNNKGYELTTAIAGYAPGNHILVFTKRAR
jgi:hypothetical protein